MLQRSKDDAGHLGRRRKVREEKRNPTGKSLTSLGARSLLPAGRLNLYVPASLRPTAATAAVRRRALPPVSKEPIRTRGVVWTPRLHRLSTARWSHKDFSPSSLLCQWQRQPLLFVPCKARLSGLLQSALECYSSQEFELLPTLKSAHVRRGTEGFQKYKPTQQGPVQSRSLSDRAHPHPFTMKEREKPCSHLWKPKEDVGSSFRKHGGKGDLDVKATM